jgi:hypothetical protein
MLNNLVGLSFGNIKFMGPNRAEGRQKMLSIVLTLPYTGLQEFYLIPIKVNLVLIKNLGHWASIEYSICSSLRRSQEIDAILIAIQYHIVIIFI